VAYLLDTNVVAELRKRTPHRHVLAWHQTHAHATAYLSALAIGEIRQGIERIRGRDAAQAKALEGWLNGLVSAYRDRILPVTIDIAEAWGRLNVPPQPPPIIDGLMAATAKVHRLTLVTRNVNHLARTGISIINPFEPL
jgi:toxin FitB